MEDKEIEQAKEYKAETRLEKEKKRIKDNHPQITTMILLVFINMKKKLIPLNNRY